MDPEGAAAGGRAGGAETSGHRLGGAEKQMSCGSGLLCTVKLPTWPKRSLGLAVETRRSLQYAS